MRNHALMTRGNPPPELPDDLGTEALQALDEAGLQAHLEVLRAAERDLVADMEPFERRLRELRSRIGAVATERRRRERLLTSAARREVRARAGSAELPSLAEALASEGIAPDDTRLADLAVYLRTGGECRLGFATKPGPTSFTDGRQSRPAQTWGEARELYAMGWELGTAQLPGVRIHLVGTRVERVVPADDLVVRPAATAPVA